jgi:hypothetical protein
MLTSFSSTNSPAPDGLFAADTPRITMPATLLSGENRTRGAVVGKVTVGAATAAAAAGNTGNGAISAITTGANAKPGLYKVIAVEPVTNLGTFVVEDPDGIIVGRAIVGAAFSGPIGFTISDGGTDFVAGDAFDITVAAGSGKLKLCAAAATDGSQRPIGILAMDTDASAGDKATSIYRTGVFNETALTFGAGHTADSVRAALEAQQIYLTTVIPA